MKFSPEDVNQLISERRSVFPREYSGETVSDHVVRQILENANWAPNHKLTEPWRFVVFSGPGLQRLAEFQSGCYRRVMEARGTFREERYRDLQTKPMNSSHIIAVGMKRDEKKSLPEIEEIGAVFCAVQNMYLTATAYGVGSYLSTGGITYLEEAKDFFGLGTEDKLLGFFHLGIPKGSSANGKRRSVMEKVKWVVN